MLKSLYVKNYVLIDEIHIQFGSGLNIITGETGAGKSILVDALGAILGETLSRDSIRHGESKAVFEGHFEFPQELPEVRELLHANDLENLGHELILRRELNESGRSRCFVNDSPAVLSVMSELGELLVDLHGQHEHQQLLKPSKHIDYLDAFADVQEDVHQLRHVYLEIKSLEKELKNLKDRQSNVNQARDLLLYQQNEIRAVAPQAGEDEELRQEERILSNAEKLFERTTWLFDELYEKDGAISEKLKAAETSLGELAQIDQNFLEIQKQCENARIIVDDLAVSLQHYSQDITFDAERLETIRQRLAVLNGLKKKYGGSLERVLDHQKQVEDELAKLENLQESIRELESHIETKREELSRICAHVSQQRERNAEILSKHVTQQLVHLGMEKAEFKIVNQKKQGEQSPFARIDGTAYQVTSKGIDSIEFLIRTNPGDVHKPLAHIASGGEISRVMLALKTVLAESDQVPVLIFDEIDAGISGRIAHAVGVNLRDLSRSHQIISITHLPQIASMADDHLLVEKESDASETRTLIRKLQPSEREEHIARLFGGETVTEAHLKSAADLMSEAQSASKQH